MFESILVLNLFSYIPLVILKIRLCDSCLASVGKGTHPSMSGRNYSPGAAWRWTRLNHAGYVDHESGELSPFLSIPGFQHGTISYDWMHNIYLGVARDLIASALKLMITKGIWGDVTNDDWDSVLAAIHFEMHQACAKQWSLGSNVFVLFVCLASAPHDLHSPWPKTG